MLFACLLIGGPITGAHYNPAVTVGVYISNKFWKKDMGMFFVMIAGQVVGATVGVMLAWLSLYNGSGDSSIVITSGGVPKNEVNLLLPAQPGVTMSNAYQIETICTFMFVMINLLVKTGKTSPTNDGFLSCLAVAFTLLAMICVAGSKSGACLNPAVAIAQTIFEICQYGNQIPLRGNYTYSPAYFTSYLPMYILAPLTGAVIAGLAHRGHLIAYDRMNNNDGNLNTSKLIE